MKTWEFYLRKKALREERKMIGSERANQIEGVGPRKQRRWNQEIHLIFLPVTVHYKASLNITMPLIPCVWSSHVLIVFV